jgi:copper chaperone
MKETKTMALEFLVENIKCGGCENSIVKGLQTIEGVESVRIERESQRILVDAPETQRTLLASKLRSMGYPEQGSVQGLEAGVANVKSFVSCAIGRMSSPS